MKRTLCFNGLLFFVCFSSLKAQEKQHTALKDVQPSIAFLEYLADMTEVDGEFLDPQDIVENGCQKMNSQQNDNNESTNGQQNVAKTEKENQIQNKNKNKQDSEGCENNE